jgi:hypothetical protein
VAGSLKPNPLATKIQIAIAPLPRHVLLFDDSGPVNPLLVSLSPNPSDASLRVIGVSVARNRRRSTSPPTTVAGDESPTVVHNFL